MLFWRNSFAPDGGFWVSQVNERRIRAVCRIFLVSLALLRVPAVAQETDDRWWPVQKAPAAVVKTIEWHRFEPVTSPSGRTMAGPFGATHMTVQSLAGLTARAVNEGRLDEMIWIDTPDPNYRRWYDRLVKRLGLTEQGPFTVWELVQRYRDKGLVRGYVLYSFDHSEGGLFTKRPDMDRSVNVATSVAGLLGGILIEEGQEARALELGLKRLLDARGKTPSWCFNTYREQFSRRLLLVQDPKDARNRAMAVAHRCMVAFGQEEPVPQIMAWLEPLSPIMGWNCGDEFSFTFQATRFGHFQTASNYCLNLPVLSAGSDRAVFKRVRQVDPKELDPDDARHLVSFVMTDGDNLQWMMGGFFGPTQTYWDHPQHGRFPFSWTTCMGHLSQMCPQAVDYLAETLPSGASLVQYNGGYYYPDLFGCDRPEPNLLARHARRISKQMQRTGVSVLGFICRDVSSDAAMRAYRTFAKEIDGLSGMIAVQYTPYEGGHGEVYWVKNARGQEIPVVTVRYCIWAGSPTPGSGTPAKIARLLNTTAADAEQKGHRSQSVVMVHAWSRFREAAGEDETAEEVPAGGTGTAGLSPVAWCVQRLEPRTRVVSAEELMWRLRARRKAASGAR